MRAGRLAATKLNQGKGEVRRKESKLAPGTDGESLEQGRHVIYSCGRLVWSAQP